ncbi:MAG: DUF4212 domain-containing protein [Bacteroidia bacterium]|nr:DUF4212 domain-containing protein [Bacteroidia bacterium]
MSENPQLRKIYRRKIAFLFLGLLGFWALALIGGQLLISKTASTLAPGEFDPGIWFAQQGIMYLFVILLMVFLFMAKKLDQKYKGDDA